MVNNREQILVDIHMTQIDYVSGERKTQLREGCIVEWISFDPRGLPNELQVSYPEGDSGGYRAHYWVGTEYMREYLGFDRFFDPVLSQFGPAGNTGRVGRRTKSFLRDIRYIFEAVKPFSVDNRINHFCPKTNEEELTVGIFLNNQDKERDKRSWMKPGRAFRRMFPELSDVYLERLVDEFRERFTPANLTLHVGTKPHDFNFAYSREHAPYQNPHTTDGRKSLANSCMRYGFDNLPQHPAEAYASGEFKIVYTTDDNDRVASRCVVWCPPDGTFKVWQAAPIYGVNEHALDLVEKYLDENGATKYEDGSEWSGAKLKAIPHDRGYIAPYLDCNPRSLEVSDCGKHLVCSRYGEIDASDYSGILGGPAYECTCCGGGISEEGAYYNGHCDGCFCEYCFSEENTFCEETQEYWPNDEVVLINSHRYDFYVHQDHLDNYVFVESRNEYWSIDDVETNVEDCDSTWYFVRILDIDDFVWVESESCYYHVDRAPQEPEEEDSDDVAA